MAAERILNLCRQYSDGAFHVLVPKQAKSAATMICFGADVIHMSKTSELGPIDPQVPEAIGDSFEFIPADLVINSYRRLLQEAAACEGRVEPYLQQLQRYDSRKIAMLERSQELGEDIAVTALQQSMMKGLTPQAIRKRIRLFTKAETKKAHGRPILIDQARECGLNVEETDTHGPLWRQIMELHLRSDMFVSQDHCKLIESAGLHFSVPARRE
jgi:ClpP class serine protease